MQRFRARKEAGLRELAAGRFTMAAEALSSALEQWRGPVLSDLRGLGFAAAYAAAYAAALDDERVGVIEARASADIARGRRRGRTRPARGRILCENHCGRS
ncbi:hypothetical protein OIE68_13840 [Nocardia vinacea]|uniref:Bacterial transcriptional activator domain-containing protein n=1 Tax=Nocardia vinacea TaxID=96468 RepID=A0ABZ1YUA5_9NOCA|nr:hypothetical protein OIE68_13840 [Nocardia vinacea]